MGQNQRGGGRVGYFLGRGRSGSRGGFGGRRGSYGVCGYVPNRVQGGNRGRDKNIIGSFDLQACYGCKNQGHLACDCTQAGNMTGGTSSYVASTQPSMQRGTRHGRGNTQRVRFNGLNVVYNKEGYDYPINDERRIYVPLDSEIVSEMEHLKTAEKETKN